MGTEKYFEGQTLITHPYDVSNNVFRWFDLFRTFMTHPVAICVFLNRAVFSLNNALFYTALCHCIYSCNTTNATEAVTKNRFRYFPLFLPCETKALLKAVRHCFCSLSSHNAYGVLYQLFPNSLHWMDSHVDTTVTKRWEGYLNTTSPLCGTLSATRSLRNSCKRHSNCNNILIFHVFMSLLINECIFVTVSSHTVTTLIRFSLNSIIPNRTSSPLTYMCYFNTYILEL